MSLYRPRSQRRGLLAVLILASITVITLDFRSSGELFGGARGSVGSALAPVRRAASAVISPITGFFSGLTRSNALETENGRLRDENADLRSTIERQGQAMAEVDSMRSLLGLKLPPELVTVAARVYATGASTFEWTVEIDKGTRSGVAVGQPVVSGDGLVGRVHSARPDSAVVQLLTDPGFAAGARLEGSKEAGTVSGGGTGPLIFQFLSNPLVPVVKGEKVFTFGGPTSDFPAGLLIGVVGADVPARSSLQRTLPVEPAMRSSRLQVVKVLLT